MIFSALQTGLIVQLANVDGVFSRTNTRPGSAFLGTLSPGGTVSHLAHLGGMIFGYVYIKTQFSRKRVRVGAGSSINFNLGQAWKDYKIQRAKKKFQVYMKKHGNGPWVN